MQIFYKPFEGFWKFLKIFKSTGVMRYYYVRYLRKYLYYKVIKSQIDNHAVICYLAEKLFLQFNRILKSSLNLTNNASILFHIFVLFYHSPCIFVLSEYGETRNSKTTQPFILKFCKNLLYMFYEVVTSSFFITWPANKIHFLSLSLYL